MAVLPLRPARRLVPSRRGLGLLLTVALAVMALPRSAGAAVPSGFSEAIIASPTAPTAMEFAPDGRLFLSEQAGRLRV